MIKKTMTYTDVDGNERTKTFHFHLSKAEILEMEMGVEGGMAEMLNEVVNSKDGKKIIEVFKEIIFKAYGEKSSDGNRFIKSKELSEEFSQTEAYSDLFVELATNAEASAAFVRGIIPQTN